MNYILVLSYTVVQQHYAVKENTCRDGYFNDSQDLSAKNDTGFNSYRVFRQYWKYNRRYNLLPVKNNGWRINTYN